MIVADKSMVRFDKVQGILAKANKGASKIPTVAKNRVIGDPVFLCDPISFWISRGLQLVAIESLFSYNG